MRQSPFKGNATPDLQIDIMQLHHERDRLLLYPALLATLTCML